MQGLRKGIGGLVLGIGIFLAFASAIAIYEHRPIFGLLHRRLHPNIWGIIEESKTRHDRPSKREPSNAIQLIAPSPQCSNGRDVRTFLEFVLRALAERVIAAASSPSVITDVDIVTGLRVFLESKNTGAALN